jgi:hypothetical protein
MASRIHLALAFFANDQLISPDALKGGKPMRKSAGVFLLTAFCTLTAMAQGTFVYTNNDQVPNSISAFSAAANGTLSPVPGSPFATGGNGMVGGFFAANRITTAVIENVLYAANTGSDNISAFSINPVTGVLTALAGSPFATGGIAGGAGTSLTVTPDKKFLIAANGTSETITVFSVAANGTLSQVPGSPFASGASGSLVNARATSDGKFLAVSATPGTILMFSISAAGALAPAGSPLADAGAAGIDCNCASSQLYVALNTTSTMVDVLDIGMSGALSRIASSPFIGPGMNSNVAILSPDDSTLFVTDQSSNTITVFRVAANGSLAVVPGSPFPVLGSGSPAGAATNRAGNLLYAASFNNLINGFSIAANGALTPVPGSPFSNGFPGLGLLSLAVFPAKTCCPPPIITNTSATPDILWPPNHKFVEVTIDYTVTEPCPHTCVLTVSSNEPINGVGDGNSSPDWQVVDAHHVLLRAERSGPGNGRIYTVNITCTNDLNHETSSKSVMVLVPHDQSTSNRIDDPLFFVHQQYLDFLHREPDPLGANWVNLINNCTARETSCDRINVSEAFFKSPEFQDRGYFVWRFYPISFPNVVGVDPPGAGHKPEIEEFVPDLASVSGFLTQAQLEAAKAQFAVNFTERPAFFARYGSLSNADYVNALASTGGVTLANQQALITALNTGTLTRAQVLRQIAESPEVFNKYYNEAFVVMQYFGYLRRNPDALYLDWIKVLDANPADSRHMIGGFVNSSEYRNRFGP